VLRSALRQDPDVIMVGEMRDAETAEIGVRAAMTGHLVLSTLHTNDSISTVNRLVDMGIPGYMVATALNAVIAQRLVRRVCENCATPYEPTPGEQAWMKAMKGDTAKARFRHGTGCQYCNNTGYRGRIGVYELLELDGTLAEHLRSQDYTAFERAAAVREGFRPLAQSGLDFAMQGITTITEVIRVTGNLEDLPSYIRTAAAAS
jgi:MSHA biogenesis protein MshE